MTVLEYIENEVRKKLHSLNYDRASFIDKKLISNIHNELIKNGSCFSILIFDTYENHKGFSYPYLSDIKNIIDRRFVTSTEKNQKHIIYFDICEFRNDKLSQII